MKLSEVESKDYEIRNYHKLDRILSDLCKMVVKGQHSDKDYGMVAACVLDPENNIVSRLNRPGKNGKRIHAEHAAINAYKKQYGDIPEGSIILSTLSPCNHHMDERDGPACADLIKENGVLKVYCGYMDPTMDKGKNDHRHYNLMETENSKIRELCQKFADTFLDRVK
jgi:pyrimidine deaminase RibD-like protein